jgi:uncharacterized membrane protein YciS (DUF1049 family)
MADEFFPVWCIGFVYGCGFAWMIGTLIYLSVEIDKARTKRINEDNQ